MELDKVLKDNPPSPLGDDDLENGGIGSSGLAVQQSELKKDTILSFLDSKKQTSFKQLEGILDERLSAVVTRYLASSRALTRSFDMYLQKVGTTACCVAVLCTVRVAAMLLTCIVRTPL